MAGASNGFSKSCASACRSLYASYRRSFPDRNARSERPGLAAMGGIPVERTHKRTNEQSAGERASERVSERASTGHYAIRPTPRPTPPPAHPRDHQYPPFLLPCSPRARRGNPSLSCALSCAMEVRRGSRWEEIVLPFWPNEREFCTLDACAASHRSAIVSSASASASVMSVPGVLLRQNASMSMRRSCELPGNLNFGRIAPRPLSLPSE